MKNKFRTVTGGDKCGSRRDEWRSLAPIIDIVRGPSHHARNGAILFYILIPRHHFDGWNFGNRRKFGGNDKSLGKDLLHFKTRLSAIRYLSLTLLFSTRDIVEIN